MATFTKGQSGELEEILDFINMVFSMHSRPHNFRSLLPKLYGEDARTECFHYLAREEGKLRAVVLVYPITLKTGELTVTCGTLGSVSVHPYSRGKGYMKALMAMAMEDMEKNGIDLGVLDGRRHRYQYYGYEPTGHALEYKFIPDDFRHCQKNFKNFPVTLTPLTEEDPIQELWAMHQSLPVHTVRPLEKFSDICHSWNQTVYVIRLEGETAGYLCASDNRISEMVLREESLLFSVLEKYFSMIGGNTLFLRTAPYEQERIQMLSSFYESVTIFLDNNYKILDFPKTLRFFLTAARGIKPLSEGSLTFRIGEKRPFTVTVSSEEVSVSETDREADLILSEIQATRLFFSPQSFCCGEYAEVLAKVNWFPLPLCISNLDKC